MELLSTTLPTQSTFFVQILLVDTFLNMGTEILRVVPVASATVRRFIGPRLTEKERNTTWFGIRPLADPWEFEHADVLAGCVLYFMVLFGKARSRPNIFVLFFTKLHDHNLTMLSNFLLRFASYLSLRSNCSARHFLFEWLFSADECLLPSPICVHLSNLPGQWREAMVEHDR